MKMTVKLTKKEMGTVRKDGPHFFSEYVLLTSYSSSSSAQMFLNCRSSRGFFSAGSSVIS